MEVITEMEVPNKTLTEVSPISQPISEETVVTTTVVKETEVSVVNEVDAVSLQEEKFIGNLVDKDEGLKVKVNCSENGAFSVTGVDLDVFGEGKSGFLADPMDVCSSGENKKTGDNGIDIFEFKEDIEDQDESEQEEDHGFVVGDFVWAKIKSYQWWPGQIYDSSDASDWAATLKRKGRLLVVCFGDDSFSWCSPKQLKPFIDHFDEMLAQSVSKKFVNAVRLALEEASRLVERELTCKCQTSDVTESVCVVNRGIREGVHVPKGNTVKDLVNLFEPVALVSSLKAYATMGPAAGLFELEFAVVKSCLRGFYAKKGGLVECEEPTCIEGLEEESGADPDITGLTESPENSDDKLHRRRKQKSVEELFGEDETEIKKAKVSRNASVKDRKRKVLVVSVEPESDYEDNGGGDNGVGGGEEEITSSRQRKKSKYLSPPYLSPVVATKLSVLGSGSFKEPKPESEKVSGMAAEQVEDSPKKSSGKGTRQKRRAHEGSDSQEHTAASLTVNVTEVLNGLLLLALDPSAFVENLQAITEFISSFRGLIFRDKPLNERSQKKGAEDKTLGSIVRDGSQNKTSQKKDPEDKTPGSILRGRSRNKTSEKKDAEDKTSDIAFVKNKLKWMWQTVHACEEGEMKAGLKESLKGGIQEVLEKVGNMQQGK